MERLEVAITTTDVRPMGRAFLRAYVPMLLSFMASRILIQTDLAMVAPVGEIETAAFSVPMRVMLVDTIVALAIGPVIAVAVARDDNTADRAQIVNNALSLSYYLGILLLAIGLLVYPSLVQVLVENEHVERLAKPAVLWLTFAIPARFVQFIGSMVLFASGRGRAVVPMLLVSIGLNVVLNWILIYRLNLGFEGSYISTFIISHVELLWTLWLLRSQVSITRLVSFPKGGARHFMDGISAELARVLSWQLLWLALLALFNADAGKTARLSAYSVTVELYFFLTMSLIAAMRSTAIVFAGQIDHLAGRLNATLRPILVIGVIVCVLTSLALVFFGPFLAQRVFHLSADALPWWQASVFIIAATFPISYVNAIQKGLWQSCNKFKLVFLVEAAICWMILFPVMYAGVSYDEPWLAWGGFAAFETFSLIALYAFRPRVRSLVKDHGGATRMSVGSATVQ